MDANKSFNEIFEHVACGRCNGDKGAFRAYGHVNDGKCFSCDSTGFSLTKRGQAAFDFYRDLSRVAFADLKPGMLVRQIESHGARVVGTKLRVGSVEGDRIIASQGCGIDFSHTGTEGVIFHLLPTREQQAAMIAKALDFQASLGRAAA